jgi:hypothetical protein
MMTIFFTSPRLMVLQALPKGTKFNHDYFIHTIFPGLYNETTRISRKKGVRVCQSTWTIRRVIMVTRSLRNVPTEALNELDTNLILQTSVRATFDCLAC